jgi:PII-like signaling protein
MNKQEDYTLMKIFLNENLQHKGKPTYQAIVQMLIQENIRGATVLRGISGVGAEKQIHTDSILRLIVNLPLVIEVVDKDENIERILPEVQKMAGNSLVTLEKVMVTQR